MQNRIKKMLIKITQMLWNKNCVVISVVQKTTQKMTTSATVVLLIKYFFFNRRYCDSLAKAAIMWFSAPRSHTLI